MLVKKYKLKAFNKKDIIFHDFSLQSSFLKFIVCGRTATLEYTLYNVYFWLKKNIGLNFFFLLLETIEKLKPSLSIKVFKQKQKKGKIFFKITPYALRTYQRYQKSLLWLIRAIRLRKNTTFKRVILELLELNFLHRSSALKKKLEQNNYINRNKRSLRFRW